MKALVTGGTGFVGRSVCRALAEAGHDASALSRGRSTAEPIDGVRLIRADVRDRAALEAAMSGCEVVFHTAAKVGIAGTRQDFESVNVTGTQNVIDACRSQGVARLVFTSTPSVVIGDRDLEGATESTPYPPRYPALYPETKAEAERRVMSAHDAGLATISLRPHIIWGPGDTSLLPRILERAGRLRRIGPGGKLTDVTYIDDAVQAHLRADDALAHHPDRAGGKAYFISSGVPVEIWGFIDRLLAAAGRPPLDKTVPLGVAMTVARAVEAVYRALRPSAEPPLSAWLVHELTTSHWFDISAAREELGYAPRVELDDGMARLEAWLRAQA